MARREDAMQNPLTEAQLTTRRQPRPEDVRGPYFRDQTAIIHSTPFRRLKHKTQFLFAPENDHICTRIEHVLHVATIAATICRGLTRQGWALDGELAYAAGLGHDLGHAPFGHTGERVLQSLTQGALPRPFQHEPHSLRVVDCLADGQGMNLTFAVRDAILCHNGEVFKQWLEPDGRFIDPADKAAQGLTTPATWEGCAVRFADIIAYLGRDVEDALRAHLIERHDLPDDIRLELGETNGSIINTLVIDLIETSMTSHAMGFSDRRFALLQHLKDFNYERIYNHERLLRYQQYCRRILEGLFEHLQRGLDELGRDPAGWQERPLPCDRAFGRYLAQRTTLYAREGANDARLLCDYIAGMSDNYALRCNTQLTQPEPIAFDD